MAREKSIVSRHIEFADRYLLYIDILGFEKLALEERSKVERIYRILDSLNAHKHPNFKTIAFSDTILVYNPDAVTNRQEAEYIVWYLSEFAEDLHHRFTGQDLYFRAVLVAGDFSHYKLDNIECFFGHALIDAYKREKGLPGIGLFISDECNALNKYFRTARFNDGLSFVYLNRSLEYLHEFTGDRYPAPYPEVSDVSPHAPWGVEFLRGVYIAMRQNPDPSIRAKYLATWDFYARRYPGMLKALVDSDFSLSSLAYKDAWKDEVTAMRKGIRYFANRGRTGGERA